MKHLLLALLFCVTGIGAVPPVLRQSWTTNTLAYATNGTTNVNGIVHSALAGGAGITLTTNTGRITISAAGAGLGDVVGPAGATDNSFAIFDGATGKLIKEETGFLDGTNAFLPALWTWDIAVTNAITIGGTNILAAIAAAGGGSGDDVWVNHANVSNPNLTNSTDIEWLLSGTNVSAMLLGVYQPTNANLTALSAYGPTTWQATNAVLTALVADPTMYQATNANLTALSAYGPTTWQATNAALTALAGNPNLYQATNANLTLLQDYGPTTWQATNAALTALAANPNLYQATNANLTLLQAYGPTTWQATNSALTALAGNPNLYQATNANLTLLQDYGPTTWQATNAALTALANNANLYQATNANLTLLQAYGPTTWQATNAALTALAANANLYQATNANLTLWQAFAPTAIDASSATITIKTKKEIKLRFADSVYSLTMLPNTNNPTLATWMRPVFADDADKAANYITWVTTVPSDIDTGVDLTAKLFYKISGGADTATNYFEITTTDIASSAALAASPGDVVEIPHIDASGADGDLEIVAETTLTGWRSTLIAGYGWMIRLARDGDHALDASTTDCEFIELVITYTSTQ